jgi:hypothetical protein
MRIFELFEQTIAPVPPGQGAPLPPTQPTTGAPAAAANTATTATLGNQQPVPGQAPGQAPAPNPNTPQVGQPMGGSTNPQQAQQIQQGMNTTMTDLDKIAAQIVGLKQKQQQMQQQLKPV